GVVAVLVVRRRRTVRAALRLLEQRGAMDASLAEFGERVIEAGSIDEVAAAAVGPLALALGVSRVVLLRRAGGDWIAQLAPSGTAADPPPVGSAPVLTWLARNPEPVFV